MTDFPKPPFERQRLLTPPARDADMDPRPDYGEAHYKGSGRLSGRKAIITGADSGIGRAVALAFARLVLQCDPLADQLLDRQSRRGPRRGARWPRDGGPAKSYDSPDR